MRHNVTLIARNESKSNLGVLPQKRGPECPTPDVVYYSWADIDTKYSITEHLKLSEYLKLSESND